MSAEKSVPLEDLKGKLKEGWGAATHDESEYEEGRLQQKAAQLQKEEGLSATDARRKAERLLGAGH